MSEVKIPVDPRLGHVDRFKPLQGHYRGVQLNGRKTARLSCPNCGSPGLLEDHSVSPSGRVNPSVACPAELCTFHAYVTLENWNSQ